jgi:hypothetical protein
MSWNRLERDRRHAHCPGRGAGRVGPLAQSQVELARMRAVKARARASIAQAHAAKSCCAAPTVGWTEADKRSEEE